MPDEREFSLPEDPTTARPEARGFAPEQMVGCERCRRRNPPTRMSCLYCGAQLPVDEASAALRRPTLRALEAWEQGFNVVLLPRGEEAADSSRPVDGSQRDSSQPADARQTAPSRPLARRAVEEAASLVGMEAGLFEEFLRRGEALPVARVASEAEAELVASRLAGLGLRAEVVWDEVLAVESEPPRRVRRLELGGEGARGWDASGASEFFAWADVDFIAVGRIYTRRVETEERRGRVKSGEELAESREVFSDEAALEVYAAGRVAGWRILAGGFDYSCLGAEMKLLAAENFKTLAWTLRGRAADAVYDNGYERSRPLLAAAWPPAERTESGGLKRERPGKFNTEAATVVSNDAQFTRYARLRRLLAAHPRATEEG